MKLKPNDRKRGIPLARSYLEKFAWRDFPEGYRTIATDKNYETVEGYIRAVKKMTDRQFKKELVWSILYNRSEFRKEGKKDPDTYYRLGAWNIYTTF